MFGRELNFLESIWIMKILLNILHMSRYNVFFYTTFSPTSYLFTCEDKNY